MANILVVDDEIGIRELLSEILSDEGHSLWLAQNAAEARNVRQEESIDLVLLDIWMPDTDGISLLKEWASQGTLTMPVIMMSGHATIDTAVEATRIGALDFLEKPIALQKLLKAVEQGLNRSKAPTVKPSPFQAAGRPLTTTSIPQRPTSYSVTTNLISASHVTPPITYETVTTSPNTFHDTAVREASAAQMAAIGVLPQQTPNLVVPLDLPLREARDAFERIYFDYHLAQERGSMTRVANKTGLERTHLYRKLKQLGVDLFKTKSRQ